MIFVDTNIFVLALRYPRDRHAAENRRFLESLDRSGDGVTSLINVLEACGILSFNLNRNQLRALYAYFGQRFGVRILGAPAGGPLSMASEQELLAYLERKLSFGDALVAHAVETLAPEADSFVSWDARHFRGKLAPRALTPREFLRGE